MHWQKTQVGRAAERRGTHVPGRARLDAWPIPAQRHAPLPLPPPQHAGAHIALRSTFLLWGNQRDGSMSPCLKCHFAPRTRTRSQEPEARRRSQELTSHIPHRGSLVQWLALGRLGLRRFDFDRAREELLKSSIPNNTSSDLNCSALRLGSSNRRVRREKHRRAPTTPAVGPRLSV
jgi:hypothetical protein